MMWTLTCNGIILKLYSVHSIFERDTTQLALMYYFKQKKQVKLFSETHILKTVEILPGKHQRLCAIETNACC